MPYVEDSNQYHQYVVKRDMNDLENIVSELPESKLKTSIENKIIETYKGSYSEASNTFKGEISSAFGTEKAGAQYQPAFTIEELIHMGIVEKL